jgi:hypothetical protein
MTRPSVLVTIRGTVRQIGLRATLVDDHGQTWCLVGADVLSDGAAVQLTGREVGEASVVKWLLVDAEVDT